MSGARHDRSVIEEFLDGEFRQVWAVDRHTGEARYLPAGRAKLLRAVAKRDWACPVPGCDVEITTVGGDTRRHHFRHNDKAPHTSEPESEFHLAAKAMLNEWAASQAPAGASVREEHSVKDPATARLRIADVMVTWADHTKTAFEVEYKNYGPEAWAGKQGDYERHSPPIGCVWLLGHLRVKRPPANSHYADEPDLVRIPLLGQAWVKRGHPLLAINPVTRQVGTIVSHYRGVRHPSYGDTYGRLRVDALADCTLDAKRGLITPTMLEVDRTEAEARAADERARAAEARQRAEQQRIQERRAQRQASFEDLQRVQREAWKASDLHATFQQRWKTIPGLLDVGPREGPDQSGVWANPVHWRGVLYEKLIHPHERPETPRPDRFADTLPPQPSLQFTFDEVWAALARHRIRRHQWDHRKGYRAVIVYMERLQRWRVITIRRDMAGRIQSFEATGYPLEAAEKDRRCAIAEVREERELRAVRKAERARLAREARMQAAERGASLTASSFRQAPKYLGSAPLDPAREEARSRCSRCGGPLPTWQRGGYHTNGCPISA